MPILGVVAASILKGYTTFTDAFSSGSALSSFWRIITGTWAVSSSTASTTTASSSYPTAVVTMAGVNVTGTVDTPGNGAGIAFWVTDANNWWSLVSDQTLCTGCGACTAYTCNAYQCNAYTCNAYNPGSGGNTNAGSGGNTNPGSGGTTNAATPGNPYTYCSGGYNSGNPFNCLNQGKSCPTCIAFSVGYNPSTPGNVNPYVPGNTNAYTPGNVNAYTPGNCSAASCSSASCTTYSCNTYANTYPRTLKLFKYVSGVLTSLASGALTTDGGTVNRVKLVVTSATAGSNNSGTITGSAYSDLGVTQLGSNLVYNATGAVITTQYGIIASPGSYNESKTVKAVTFNKQ